MKKKISVQEIVLAVIILAAVIALFFRFSLFSKSVTQRMIAEGNFAGIQLALIIVIIFAVFIAVILVGANSLSVKIWKRITS